MEDPKDSSSSGDHSGGDGIVANAKSDSGAAAAGSTRGPNQQLQMNGLSATTAEADGLSQLAREAIVAQPGASLYASDGLLAATQQPVLAAGAGTVTTDTPAPSSQAMLAGPDATLNALLLSSGLNISNFAGLNQAALGTLLNDVSAVQVAGLQAGGLAGAAAATDTTGSGGAATNAGSNAAADAEDDGNRGPCNTQANNKQLSSRYRGVCWNKKNKRWQAAINSGGKYIYLGSFQSEDDAARQFDRAAIKIRGKKAKLNFLYADYVDADGNLLEDVILPISKDDVKPAASGRGGRSSRSTEWGELSDSVALQGDLINQAALALVGRGPWGGVGGFSENSDAFNSSQQINMADLKAFLPKGCSMDYMLPGLDPGMFGLVYKHDVTGQRGCGVWTGYKFHTFGLYVEEHDAKQTVLRSMELLHEDRQARGVAGPAAGGPTVSCGAQAAAAAGSTDPDPLISALGLGSLRTGAGTSSGAFGAGTGGTAMTMTSRGGTMAGLANYDIAHAAQLAQQAAAEQGMSTAMPYPPLSVGLPTGGPADISTAVDGSWQQQQQLSSEADLQFKLQQIMQQRQDDSSKQAAGGDGGVLSRLGNLDLAQLKQQLAGSLADTRQLLPQLQQRQLDKQLLPAVQQVVAPAAAPAAGANPITGALGSTSIEELLAGLTGAAGKRTAAVAAGGGAGGWGDLLGLTGTCTAAAGDAAAGGAALPAAKRLRVGDSEAGMLGISGITAAAAGAAAGAMGSGGEDSTAWSSLSKLGLQDALKSLYAMSGQGQQ